MLNEYLAIAEVLKPQGVRGEIKARALTNDPERFDELEFAYTESGGEYAKINVSLVRRVSDIVYLKIDGVNDRDAAEKLRGALLYIDRLNAVELDEDENFICDLIGLRGIDDEGETYGALTDVLQPGGNDVYVFTKNGRETLVPALKTAILKVDLTQKTVLMSAARLREVAVTDDI